MAASTTPSLFKDGIRFQDGTLQTTAATGGGTPGGSNGDIQFNNSGTFGGVTLVPLANGGTDADLSATGGANKVLKQSSVGGPVTVAALVSGDIPNNAANTSGTSSNVSGTPALPNGTTATTQTPGDNTTKLSTTAFVTAAIAAIPASPVLSVFGRTGAVVSATNDYAFGQLSGKAGLAQGGTNVDLSASGSATAFLAQDASHVVSARSIVAADVPNLPASIITSGQLALARGGTNADLSATGAASNFLRQNSSGAAITVVQPAFTDLSGALANSQMPTTFESAGIGYFNSFWGMAPPATGGSAIAITTAKLVYATQVLYPMTVRKIVFKVNTAVAASKVYIALYNSAGTLVANSSNGGAAGSSIAVVSTTLGTPFTINPGLYYVFVQADTTGISIDGNGFAANADTILNANAVRVGTATNGISGAAVPGTLGSLAAASNSIPHVLFEA